METRGVGRLGWMEERTYFGEIPGSQLRRREPGRQNVWNGVGCTNTQMSSICVLEYKLGKKGGRLWNAHFTIEADDWTYIKI